MKRNKLITKRHNLVNKEEANRIEKKIEKIGKSKDDSSRMFKAIKDLIKLKLKTPLLIKKEGSIYSKWKTTSSSNCKTFPKDI